ncbi:transcriptional regulator [Rhodococcus sp. 14-2470-1b]|nr:helix-turn-helix domain-containing protein [Rhodococcus sp. 14-2470-1b]OZF52436.1 transcriptional regulator [Rhodococcus sp. 14-2470-1b]
MTYGTRWHFAVSRLLRGKRPAVEQCCRDGNDAYQWDTREDCEVRQILDRIADKWSLLVISLLDEKIFRFGELMREINGVSTRMLTVTLRNLERDGLVVRRMYPEIPLRVEYRLSNLGRTLLGTTQALVHWTERHQSEIARARKSFDANQTKQGSSG